MPLFPPFPIPSRASLFAWRFFMSCSLFNVALVFPSNFFNYIKKAPAELKKHRPDEHFIGEPGRVALFESLTIINAFLFSSGKSFWYLSGPLGTYRIFLGHMNSFIFNDPNYTRAVYHPTGWTSVRYEDGEDRSRYVLAMGGGNMSIVPGVKENHYKPR